MTWRNEVDGEVQTYEYIGDFNKDGQFEGHGKLIEPNGVY